jgi:hypothetical protein
MIVNRTPTILTMEKLGTTSRPASRAPSEETVHNVPSPADATIAPVPFSGQFLDKTPEAAAARAIYLKTVFGGVGALVVVIFAVFSIYWGSVWSAPHHSLPGWIVVSTSSFLSHLALTCPGL